MVTLVTGDRVLVRADGTVAVHAGVGRDGIGFTTQRAGQRVNVVPSDAAAPLAAGRLDRRLFHVTLLAEIGDRTGSTDLGLIITGGGRDLPAVPAALAVNDIAPVRDLPALGEVFLEVPPEPARYRVEVAAERHGPAPLSRQTSLAWEFDSGYQDDETWLRLPVSVVQFRPDLAPDNTAPAGRPFRIPVSVQPAPDSGAGEVARLTVEVSFDDGAIWRRATIAGDGHVMVRHPRGEGFVSLRAHAVDTDGNVVEQTIIRAYAFR